MNRSIVKYPHPSRLSDPYGDFEEAELDAIVRKSDSELSGTDLICIFQSHMPAGAYEECAYYLPIVVNHIISESLDYVDVCFNLLHWMSDNKSSLEKDKLFDIAQNELVVFFCKQFRSFSIVDNYPVNIDIIKNMLVAWNDLDNFNHLGDELLNKILPPFSTYFQAAWTCYLIYDYYSYSPRGEGYSKVVPSWGRDDVLKKKLRDVILDYVLPKENDSLLRFWNKILTQCGMF